MPDIGEDGSAVPEIFAHRCRMIEERVFDFVAVRSEESREFGESSEVIIDVAGFEKGEHDCIRGGCSSCTCCLKLSMILWMKIISIFFASSKIRSSYEELNFF